MTDPTYCINLRTIRSTPLPEQIRLAGGIGFQAVEVLVESLEAYLQEGGQLDTLARLAEDSGVRIATLCEIDGWTNEDFDTRQRKLGRARQLAEFAHALGGPDLIAAAPDEPVAAYQAAEYYQQLVEICRPLGVRALIDFSGLLRAGDLRTFNGAIATFETSGCSTIEGGVVLDIFHLIRSGGSAEDVAAARGDQIGVVHINDMPATPSRDRQDESHRVMPGDGRLRLGPILEALRSIDYQGPYSLEISNPRLWEQPPLDILRRGYFRMRQALST